MAGALMENNLQLRPIALGIAISATWGISILTIGILAHFTGFGAEFMQSVDNLYPGTGTSLQGILIALIFGIIHGFVMGSLIGWIYNAYLSTQAD